MKAAPPAESAGAGLRNLVVFSDPHFGCQSGLCPPDGASLSGGGRYKCSRLQAIVFSWWQEFWNEFVPAATHGEPYIVLSNGDTLEGRHHQATTQFSQNLADQQKLAVRVLRPIIRKAERFYMVRGTEAHVGPDAENEEKLAEQLKAKQTIDGNYSRYDLWLRMGDHLIHALHHIGVTSSTQHETSALNSELSAELVEAAKMHRQPPSVILRAHRHRASEVRIPTDEGPITVAVTPGWQLKMLALNTPLPTPSGWTTMGEVQVGGVLFDEKGKRCRVIAAHPITMRPESYSVRFSNGETVRACADHLWQTTACVDRPGVPGHGGEKRPLTRVRTTREIKDTLTYGKKGDRNHHLQMPEPLLLPDTNLPVDPYILGCWLGDGDSDGARLTCSKTDAAQYKREFAEVGYILQPQANKGRRCPRFSIRRARRRPYGPVPKRDPLNLRRVLRDLGVIGNKHIPQAYLRASFSQRLALLQGLMDTDGQTDGRSLCLFTTTRPALRDGIAELLATLGIKFVQSERTAKLYGRELGAFWIHQFFMSPDVMPVFRLSRKLGRVPLASSRKTAQKSRVVHIVSVEPCEPVPMRCIAVDSPSRLYRFGRTMLYTHNTPHTWKIAGARLSQPQFGGTVVRLDGRDQPYTQAFLRFLTPDEPEVA